MTKKKSATADHAAKKKTGRKSTGKKKHMDPAQVREELAGIVKSGARDIAKAVMGHAKQGELAPAKYLLEMAGVFPAMNEGEHATEEEDCLAKTLLDRLNVTKKPSQDEEDDAEEAAGKIPTSRAENAREMGHPRRDMVKGSEEAGDREAGKGDGPAAG